MKMENTTELFNRFPLLAVIAYLVAKKAGYSERLAQALGYAYAKKLSILKNIARRRCFVHTGRAFQNALRNEEKAFLTDPNYEVVRFIGQGFLVSSDGETILGDLYVKDFGVVTAEHYRREIEKKIFPLGEGAYAWLLYQIEKEAEKRGLNLADFAPAVSGDLFLRRFWYQVRDEMRTAEYWRPFTKRLNAVIN